MTSTMTRDQAVSERSPRVKSTTYTVLVTLATLAIVLQGLWAGLFLGHRGENWIEVHARGGEVSLVLTALATVVAFVRLRQRRDLWLGAASLTGLIVVEAYLGGLIHDDGKDSLTAVHVPLAMAIVCLSVWLLVRSRRSSPTTASVDAYPAADAQATQVDATGRASSRASAMGREQRSQMP
jgi:hypothetical protein